MRRFKSIYIIIPLIILVFFAGTQPAHAGWFDWGNVVGGIVGFFVAGPVGAVAGWAGAFDWAGDLASGAAGAIAKAVVGFAVGILNILLIGIGSVLMWAANWVVEVAIAVNTTIQDSLVVKNGFDIVLSVANLGLVVAIVIAAFMVMLRRSGASQTLFRFVIVAVLINFSFYIVTAMLIKPTRLVISVRVRSRQPL